jgi:hypothetical protein
VIARNTAFTYKGKPFEAKQIGRDLNVRYVLEGSVQRSGNRPRVMQRARDDDRDAGGAAMSGTSEPGTPVTDELIGSWVPSAENRLIAR